MNFCSRITKGAVYALGLVCTLSGAEYEIFNSGFELGTAGYICNKFLRPDLNTKMVFERPVLDSNVKVSGRASLRIPNRFAERVILVGREVQLEKGKQYICSIWMKSSVPQEVLIDITGTKPELRWDSGRKSFDVGTEWKQFSFSFTPKKAVRFYSPCLTFGQKLNDPAADFWLDDWKITPAAEKQPAARLEVAAIPEKRYFIKKDNESLNIPVAVSVYNPETAPRTVNVTLTATEDFSGNWPDPISLGRSVTMKVPPMTLAAGETRSVTVSLPISRYGAYLLTPKADHASVFGKPFSVIGKVTPVSNSIHPPFCAAINARDLFGRPPRNRFKTISFRGIDCTPDEYMEFLAACGIRLIRSFGYPNGTMSWTNIEPEEGKFQFDGLDRFVDLTSRHGIQLLPVLGEMDFCSINNFLNERQEAIGIPNWLIPRCQKKLLPRETTLKQNAFLIPPMELWGRFVRMIAERYKDRIGQYEIINEPHLMCRTPADYVPFLETAYKEIKQAAPQTTVVGFCATSDLGARMEAFYKPCFQAGGLNYADAVSFHPYQNPKLGSFQPADRMIKTIRGMIKEFSPKNYPLWNTELYYLRGDTGNEYIKGYAGSADLAQRTLLDLGEGITQSISLEHTQIQRIFGPHYMSSNGFNADLTPNSLAVTLNTLARLFEGASPIAKLRWKQDVICYVVRRADGTLAAAFWHYGNRKGLSIELPAKDARAELLDVAGNSLMWKKQALPADNSPCYIRWNGKDKNVFLQYLKACAIEADQPVLASAMVRLVPANGGTWNAAVMLKNTSSKPVTGRLGLGSDGISAKTAPKFQLSPEETRMFEIPVTIERETGKAKIRLLYNGQRNDFPVMIPATSRVYRLGKTWESFSAVKGKNPVDSAKWRMEEVNGELVLNVEVNDTTPSGAPGMRKPWEQDCVEVFLDNAPCMIPEKHPAAYHKGCFRMFLLPYAEKGKQLQFMHTAGTALNDKTVSLKTELTPQGYRLTLRIRTAALNLANPTRLGLELTVNNAKFQAPSASSRSWSGAPEAFNNRMGFGFVIW